jgi:hypothetical protein
VANLGLTSGTVGAIVESRSLNPGTTIDQVSFDVTVNGTYVLLGGTGSGLVNWNIFAQGGSSVASFDFGPCTITLAGTTENCGPLGFFTGSFTVPYNTPLQLDFHTSYSASVGFGDVLDAGVTYNFGSLSPVPEPTSLLLLALGLLSIPATVRFARSRP